jgi:hypothetical protein
MKRSKAKEKLPKHIEEAEHNLFCGGANIATLSAAHFSGMTLHLLIKVPLL